MALNYKTTQETADILHVHRQTIMRWIKSGTIKATKVGERKYLISEEEIERILESSDNNDK